MQLPVVFLNLNLHTCRLAKSTNKAWCSGVAVERRIRDREVAGSGLDRALQRKNSGQVSHTYG